MPFPSGDLFPSPDLFPGTTNAHRRIPKLKVPIDFGADGFETVEQGSVDEVAQCVYAVLATERGSRQEEPAFGITDPTFEMGGMDLGEAALAIRTWEPRARAESSQEIDDLTFDVRVAVGLT